MLEWALRWQEAFGFWGFAWRGIALGLPVAVVLPVLHPGLFDAALRFLARKEKAPRDAGLE